MTADAHLASVNSYHEQKFTQQLIQSATNGAPETWIGGFEVLHVSVKKGRKNPHNGSMDIVDIQWIRK